SGREAYEAAEPDAVPVISPQGFASVTTRPGLHIACLEWLRQHDVSALVWDLMDERPIGYDGFVFGVHLGIPLLGLCLIDNAALDALATACKEEGRSEFLFSAMPLRIVGSTGSPCQPVAIF
ncbi:MAG: hypothetical protein J4F42_22325, partial [Desulfurellaceae bacterium]|nr:hypothetical protein [Desulfurellaceae bacterium]